MPKKKTIKRKRPRRSPRSLRGLGSTASKASAAFRERLTHLQYAKCIRSNERLADEVEALARRIPGKAGQTAERIAKRASSAFHKKCAGWYADPSYRW